MLSWITIVVLVCSVYSTIAADNCTPQKRQEANLCADKLFFAGKNSRPYPESDQHVDKHCKETLQLVQCVSHYTDHCRQGTHRPTTSVMLSTVRHNQRNYCSRPNKRRELIELGVCANAIRHQSSACADKFLSNLGRAGHAKRPHKIPHGCCSFFQLKKCILIAAEQAAGAECSHVRRQLLEKYIDSMAGNTINLLCDQYDDDSDRCARLPALPSGQNIASASSIFNGFAKLLN